MTKEQNFGNALYLSQAEKQALDDKISKTIGSLKGSLIGFQDAQKPIEIRVGADGQVLTADSTKPSGLDWQTVSGTGGGSTAGVTTFNGRAGDVEPLAGDYTYTDVGAAPLGQGVTNGDLHDHNGGDGAQINHTTLSNVGTNTHAQLDSHIASTSNPHSVTAAQAGAEPALAPGTTSQYYRGDKSWQTLDKDAVGLTNVPNLNCTIPTNISQDSTHRFVTDAQTAAWDAKQDALGFDAVPDTITVNGQPLSGNVVVTKSDVGLGNVPDVDCTDPANITQDVTHRFATDAEKVAWNSQVIPDQSGNNGKFLTTDGSDLSWAAIAAQLINPLAPVLNIQTTPPVAPSGGDRYVVLPTGTDDWSGHDNAIAVYNGGTSSWDFTTPNAFDALINADDSLIYVFSGSSWISLGTDTSSLVPSTRTVNGHALSADVTVTKGDVGLGNVVNLDTSNPANITADATHRFVTDTQISTWGGKQDALGFTAVPNTRTVNGHALSSNVAVTKGDVGLGNVPNTDCTNPANIVPDSTHRFTTDTEKATWNAKQDALGFTAVPNTRTINGHALSADVTVSKGDVGLGNVVNVDQTNPANIVQDSTHRFASDSEKTTWNNKQNALGFNPVPNTITVAGHPLTSNVVISGADVVQDATHRMVTDTQISTWNAGTGGGGSNAYWPNPVLAKQTTPPLTPTAGDRYIADVNANGAWFGYDKYIAEWSGTAWVFTYPPTGAAVVVIAEKNIEIFT